MLNNCSPTSQETFNFKTGSLSEPSCLFVDHSESRNIEFDATPQPEAIDRIRLSIKAWRRIITFTVNQSAARSVSEASVHTAPPSHPPAVQRNYSIV
ncbi:hypothetical protein QQF64_019371 [Cirrhinus molitorella]|uniref:Uncharacterized protein n=1 Tax=Cirrhinus molitorella TaxID=172907 RepID=A0ABR3LGV5_9TELE